MKRVDVLVAGGGPAGSTLAALAAEAGARVVLVERQAFPRDKVCGEFVSVEGRGVLERLGAEIYQTYRHYEYDLSAN